EGISSRFKLFWGNIPKSAYLAGFLYDPIFFKPFILLSGSVFLAGLVMYARRIMRNRIIRSGITALTAVLILTAICVIPLNVVYPDAYIYPHMGAVKWLAKNGGGVVLELPISGGHLPEDHQMEVRAMLKMIGHGKPIVNGYARLSTTSYMQLKNAVVNDLPGRGIRYIRAFGVKNILTDKEYVSEGVREILESKSYISIVYQDERDVIYALKETREEDIKDLLPSSVVFDNEIGENQAVGIELKRPTMRANLVKDREDLWIDLKKKNIEGKTVNKKIKISGNVIIDEYKDRIFVELISFPETDSPGEARLISEEDIIEKLGGMDVLK
ncbi:MAG: hypothetical protein PHW46_03715, partial [Candidatus Omnitrophica bacterium]|nr:hypothetical protein [Candidatus Omnitrophota bacterium]